MRVVLGGKDLFLREKLATLIDEHGFLVIRTQKIERVLEELKQIGRIAIIDVNWAEAQQPGVLKQLVNIGRIAGNKLVCICPNQEEELKELAHMSRADEVFIRFDIMTGFKEYIEELSLLGSANRD